MNHSQFLKLRYLTEGETWASIRPDPMAHGINSAFYRVNVIPMPDYDIGDGVEEFIDL
jgi:hypothetical protein